MRVLLASFFLLTACASAPRIAVVSSGSLPLVPYGVPVVPAVAGGARFDVLLDSGAARTVFDADEARRLGLTVDWRPWPVILTNGGAREWVWHAAVVEHLTLGSTRVEGLRAPAFELRALLKEPGAIAAIVGEDVLRSLVLVLDGERREVELVPSELRADALARRWPGREWRALDLRYEGGRPTVDVELAGGVTARLILDTGAVSSSFPHEILERVGATAVGSATMSGRIGGARTSELYVLEAMSLAGWEIALSVPAQGRSRGLLGMDVLDLLPIAIDGPGQKLWIGAPPAGAERRLETSWYRLSRFGSRAPESAD